MEHDGEKRRQGANGSSNRGRGGRRPGAGRKKTGRNHDAPHRARPSLSPRHPVHCVLRVRKGMPSLRRGAIYRAMQRVLVRYLGRDDFRVIHLSIQDTHLHFLVEAADRRALTRGMQSLAINAARAYHRSHCRGRVSCGKVFAYRYHATQIRTPWHARHALAYVLNNWRRHRLDWANGRKVPDHLDAYSSAPSFTGWSRRRIELPTEHDAPLPVSPPRTHLFRSDWTRYGLIDPFEVPGPVT